MKRTMNEALRELKWTEATRQEQKWNVRTMEGPI